MKKISQLTMAVALLGVSACGGPRSPINVAVKEFPGDVAIGKKATTPPLTVPDGPVNPEPLGFPSFIQPPPPLAVAGPRPDSPPPPTIKPPKAVVCGVADPLAAPKKEASKNVFAPPAAATLQYRNDGAFKYTDRAGKVQEGRYPERSTRTIASRTNEDGTFDFVVSEMTAAGPSATVFHVNPLSGIYLWQIVSPGNGGNDSFLADDNEALRLLPLPVAVGSDLGGRPAVDPSKATSMALVGTVVGKARVDACGTPIDAWEVKITEGRITGPNKQVRFTATYFIGTQYGGLSLSETVEYMCDAPVNQYCDNSKNVAAKNTATVSIEPKAVASP